jgi:outer membrane biosynthesis protein TonB
MRTQALFELVIGPSGQILQVNIAKPSDNRPLDERTQQALATAPVTMPACAQDGSYWLTLTY